MPSNFNEQTGMIETLMQRYERDGTVDLEILTKQINELKASLAQAKCDTNEEYQRGWNEAMAAIENMQISLAPPFIHKKTGNIYRRIGHGIDCTNSRDGTLVVIYCSEENGDEIYVREANEFLQKFEEVKGCD